DFHVTGVQTCALPILGAGAVADHTVTTVIPLTLGVSPRANADEDVFNLNLVALAPVLGPQMVATTPRLVHGNATAPANVVRAARSDERRVRKEQRSIT